LALECRKFLLSLCARGREKGSKLLRKMKKLEERKKKRGMGSKWIK
jgi:BMFP domain-containing protein YqiC